MYINEKPTVNTYNYGLTMDGLLQVVFIALKLLHVIDWSWGWVLAPLWMPWAIMFVVIIVTMVVIFIRETIKERKSLKK